MGSDLKKISEQEEIKRACEILGDTVSELRKEESNLHKLQEGNIDIFKPIYHLKISIAGSNACPYSEGLFLLKHLEFYTNDDVKKVVEKIVKVATHVNSYCSSTQIVNEDRDI